MRTKKERVRWPVSRVLWSVPVAGQAQPMAIHLGRLLPERLVQPTRVRSPETGLFPCGNVAPLFGFAPGGVYHAAPVTGRAVRSYRTLSPLPVNKPEGSPRQAVYFLWHFP